MEEKDKFESRGIEQKAESGVLIMVPKNDNIKGVLRKVIGEKLYEEVLGLNGTLRRKVGDNVWLQLSRGEDIAKTLMEAANPNVIGFTGSDFIIDTVLNGDENGRGQLVYGNYHHVQFGKERARNLWNTSERTRKPYADLTALFGKLGEVFARGEEVTFEADDRFTVMRGLGAEFGNAPTLAVLGSNEKDYQIILQEVREARRPLEVVCEARYLNIAKSILERDSDQRKFDYALRTVTGATEGYVRQGKEREGMPVEVADVGIEIGATFSTAIRNGLACYEKVMPTFPVYAISFGHGQKPVDLGEVVNSFKKGNSAAA